MKNEKMLDLISVILLLIGGINWGLVGMFQWNFVGSIFGYTTTITRVLYGLVGLAALYRIFSWAKKQK